MGKDVSEQGAAVSVVIPTWNAAAFVDRVLAALVRQADVTYEILVVDNGVINSDTQAVAERWRSRFPKLRYLKFEKQLGYAGAVNAGTREAKYPLVAVMNNDNIPDSRWLAELVAVFQAECKEGSPLIVGSLVSRPGFPLPLQCKSNIWSRIVRLPDWHCDGRLFHPDGSAFLFDRRIFPVPYDEDYFVYQEDVALGWKAWLMGGRVLLAEKSTAESFDGGSTRRIAYKTAYFTERNRWINYICFLSSLNFARIFPLLFMDGVIKLVAGSNRRAKLDAWIWLLCHPLQLWRRRRKMQALRRRPDAEILPLLSISYRGTDERGYRLLNPFFRGMNFFLRLPAGK